MKSGNLSGLELLELISSDCNIVWQYRLAGGVLSKASNKNFFFYCKHPIASYRSYTFVYFMEVYGRTLWRLFVNIGKT